MNAGRRRLALIADARERGGAAVARRVLLAGRFSRQDTEGIRPLARRGADHHGRTRSKRKERSVKRLVIGVAAGVATLILATSAGAHTFLIQGDSKMGSFLVKRDGTLRGAIDAFGTPGDRDRRHGGSVCVVRWPRHGLRIVFYNLGGRDACRPASGFFSNARARGPHWQTGRGLAVGDRLRRLRKLYPNAKHHAAKPGFWPAGWWLVRRWSPVGAGGYYPGLLATVEDRRVDAFHVRYPAGGD